MALGPGAPLAESGSQLCRVVSGSRITSSHVLPRQRERERKRNHTFKQPEEKGKQWKEIVLVVNIRVDLYFWFLAWFHCHAGLGSSCVSGAASNIELEHGPLCTLYKQSITAHCALHVHYKQTLYHIYSIMHTTYACSHLMYPVEPCPSWHSVWSCTTSIPTLKVLGTLEAAPEAYLSSPTIHASPTSTKVSVTEECPTEADG